MQEDQVCSVVKPLGRTVGHSQQGLSKISARCMLEGDHDIVSAINSSGVQLQSATR
jgi:hypothetical protein